MAATAPAVAVIGGGVAGAAAARLLGARAVRVTLYERSAALGGRLGSVTVGGLSVGSAAVYVKPKHPTFLAQVERWVDQGRIAEWQVGTPGMISASGAWKPLECKAPEEKWYVGLPSMSSLADLSLDAERQDVEVLLEEVTSLSRHGDRWLVNGLREFDAVIAAVPVAEASRLFPKDQIQELLPQAMLAADFEKLRISYSVVFEAPVRVPWRISFTEGSPISLVLNDSSRHGAALAGPEAWVAQTTTEWALAQVQAGRSDDELAEALHAELASLLGVELPTRLDHTVTRWWYGDGDYKLEGGCAWQPELRLALAGDWCYNGRVEGAWLSGHFSAEKVAEALCAR